MRQPRLKGIPGHPRSYFHCLPRVFDRQFVFGQFEREQFVRYLREYEEFYGVRVLTYCILSNHFHLLVEVPEKPAPPPLWIELGENNGDRFIVLRVWLAEPS